MNRKILKDAIKSSRGKWNIIVNRITEHLETNPNNKECWESITSMMNTMCGFCFSCFEDNLEDPAQAPNTCCFRSWPCPVAPECSTMLKITADLFVGKESYEEALGISLKLLNRFDELWQIYELDEI